ncbi:MMPL family transporter [Nocardioides marmoribigeumensis]|uniref:RND superfamily putative drug exporter n=1 Tax=Nocardioides marmoribigeumensis TaxID=433649 RepID=A0ABU2BY60_9ACTN|nr:MMPL family transporter [Nocardioides marmoribigeumensis]MDR7363332.1 RND superfamily putative drug exporter [Nocardioides marmoribigeumensis]
MIDRWARLVARRARTVLLLGLLVTVLAAVYGAGVFGSLSQGGFDDPDSEAARALRLEQDTFGNQSADVVAIYSSDDLTAQDPAFRRAVADVVDALPAGTVAHVVPYYAAPRAIAPSLVSQDGHHAQVLISLAGHSQDDYLTNYDRISPHLQAADGLTTDVTGSFAVYDDVNRLTSEDLERAELISMPVVILLALLIFGSLVAASMPALVGTVAMVGALAIVRLIAQVTEVSVFSVNVISLLGIGLAIDYALFVISRFREELAVVSTGSSTDAAAEAIERTLATAGRTVLFSGLTVAAALASLLIFPQSFIRSMGLGGMAAVLVAMAAALTILPALLKVLGHRVDAGRLPWRRGRAVAVEDARGRWHALARGVMRRPVVVAATVVIALLAIASPFLGVRWGSVDYRVLPDDAPAHRAAALLSEEFGPERSGASLVLRGADQATVTSYSRAVEQVDPTMQVLPVAREGGADGVTLLRASWEGNSQSEHSQAVVKDLRQVRPADGEVLVGGLTADTVDLLSSVRSHLPWMALIVVAVMLVLLFLAFGSVVLPIKAVVMNSFSITASFGVVTWIFSDGHLADALDFTPQGFLDATNPIVMLAILFGLSMDYEVFLLSRVREQWDATKGSAMAAGERNELAVATGVQKTGRIITSAALLLGVVIGAFGLSGIVFIKMLGIGMLVALLIDATVVRALLVPATMKLLGGWNWWAPAPMARWWERHGFREGHAPHAPEQERVTV